MTAEQRRQLWDKYQEFLALSPAEQERIRRLHADLEKLPPDKRDRYGGLMSRYKKWKDSLPLYQRQMLEEAATQGSTALYTTLRDVQKRQEVEDRQRPYWLLPGGPAVRKMVPKILSKLAPEEIELLDQTPPLERSDKLFWHARQLGLEVPALIGSGRPLRPREPLPPPDPEELRDFLQKLPREQLEELSDLGLVRASVKRRLHELFYLKHPEKLRERLKKGEATPETGPPPQRPPGKPRREPEAKPPQPPERKDSAKQPGKLGIPAGKP